MKKLFSRRRFLKTSTLAASAAVGFSELMPNVGANTVFSGDTKTRVPAVDSISLRLLDDEALKLESGVSFG